MFPNKSATWCQLLAPGHSLRLRFIGGALALTAELSKALTRLPTLTKVRAQAYSADDLQCFAGLPALEHLTLQCCSDSLSSEQLITALKSCRLLRTLHVRGMRPLSEEPPYEFPPVAAASMRACLAGMPQLGSLTLDWVPLDSLAFLSQCDALSHSLTNLCVVDVLPRLPPSELQHVLPLRALRSLILDGVAGEPIDEVVRAALQPRSQVLPELQECSTKYISRAPRV